MESPSRFSEKHPAIAKRQEKNYKAGEYRLLCLLNDSVPYHDVLLNRDSRAIQDANTEAALFCVL